MNGHIAWKKRMSRSKFERELDREFGLNNLSVNITTEEDGTRVTLYYGEEEALETGSGTFNIPKHIGSWCKGKGWVFKTAYK